MGTGMNTIKKITIFLMAAVLAAGTLFFQPLTTADAAGYSVKDITLQPGSDESRMNFCWQSAVGGRAVVQVEQGTGMSRTALTGGAADYQGTAAASTKGYFSNNVTVTGLSPLTEYSYRVGNGTVFSDIYSFKTGSGDSYNVIFVSDAQIGASGSVKSDTASWGKTLGTALGAFPETSFLLSAGDQVDYYLESEYDGFLASPLLRKFPIATAVGNHENMAKSVLNTFYYDEPNASAVYGLTPAGGDYWFRYGNTLYLVLNTNNTAVSEHDAFMAQAINANPGAIWTILMFHQSVYSSAEHSTAASIVTLRKNLVPVIDKYHIDAVLSGHDHCYTRTYQMLGGAAQEPSPADSQGCAVNPKGTVYITAGSASGSKYYDMKKTPEAYAAVRLQLKVPTFTNLAFTDDALILTTYRADTLKIIDTYTIVKQTASGFADVPDGAWYTPAVTYLSSRHVTDGTSKTRFSPDMVLTRAQCLVLLMKAYVIAPDTAGADNFSDAGSTWYTGYLAAAKRLGLAAGAGNNRFLPEADISRQDMLTLIYNTLVLLNKLPAAGAETSYSDENAIAPYAKNAVDAFTASGVITGSGGQLNPSGLSTRAQMAQVLYKLLSAA